MAAWLLCAHGWWCPRSQRSWLVLFTLSVLYFFLLVINEPEHHYWQFLVPKTHASGLLQDDFVDEVTKEANSTATTAVTSTVTATTETSTKALAATATSAITSTVTTTTTLTAKVSAATAMIVITSTATTTTTTTAKASTATATSVITSTAATTTTTTAIASTTMATSMMVSTATTVTTTTEAPAATATSLMASTDTATTTTTEASAATTFAASTGRHIRISGKQLLVDGKSLHLKGVNWSPVKKGWSVPEGLDFPGTVEADSLLMQQAGINVVRAYSPLLDRTVLDKLWLRGIYVLNTVYGWGGDAVDAVVARVNAVKDHPAILMWVVGNEWNYNGLYVGLSHEDATVRVREAALLIKQHDVEHPVSTVYGEVPSTETIEALSDVDVWGINAYRGGSFGSLFGVWADRSRKPMYLGEYGADAWDARSVAENQDAQAYATTVLTSEIVANSAKNRGVCLGGIIFEFSDEWWKDASGSAWVHDVGGQAPGGGPYPDSTFNEEWWGLVDVDRNPRQAYYAYQSVHAP